MRQSFKNSFEEEGSLALPAPDFAKRNAQYGAAIVAAKYCGLKHLPFLGLRGEWQHGWHPPEHNIHPEWVVGSSGLSRKHRKSKPFWVARKDQADYLASFGYRHVEAIGMPMVYVQNPPIKRESGSLLVMPVHSLETTQHDWNFDRYADQIAEIRCRFSRIVACVHPMCIKKGYWVQQFRKRDIPVVAGAHINDRKALYRMASLFSKFEFMTTNGFGSHLPYAAYFGAKVSIYGDLATYQNADFERDPIYRNCPELLGLVLAQLEPDFLKHTYSDFFCDPWRANEHRNWGSFQLGVPHRQSPSQLRRIFHNLVSRVGAIGQSLSVYLNK